jgi:hypothetical protein
VVTHFSHKLRLVSNIFENFDNSWHGKDMAPRLTAQKKAFAEHFVKLGNATAAARAAGYAHPHVASGKLLAKAEGGGIRDALLAAEIERVRGLKVSVEPPKPEERPRGESRDPLTELERALKQNLLEIAMDAAETGSTRVAATNTLLKAIGADRPSDVVAKDEQAAVKALRTLLGVRDE